MEQVASPVSQFDQVYELLRADILTGRREPGSKLNIAEIVKELDCSLGAVREALARLRAEELVAAESFKGFRVPQISVGELLELTEARIKVEWLCLDEALAKGDIAWEGQLIALLHQLSRFEARKAKDDIEEWTRTHAAFHECIVAGCRNRWLLRMHRTLHEQSERYRRLAMDAAPSPRDTHSEHAELVDALLARDSERAKRVMADHLRRTTNDLLAAIEQSHPSVNSHNAMPPGADRPVQRRRRA